MPITESEKKSIANGKVLLVDQNVSNNSSSYRWHVWYRPFNDQQYRIIMSTGCSTIEEATKQKNKIVESKIIPQSEIGLVHIKTEMSSMVFAKDDMPESKAEKLYDAKDYVVVDTETTGLSPNDEVIELAALKICNNEPVESFHFYIIPTVRINPDAQKVHGITLDFLKKHGHSASEVLEQFREFIHGFPIVGHNVEFDKRMIKNHASKVGVMITMEVGFDTLTLSKQLLSMPDNKLDKIIDRLDLRHDLKSHNAMDDVTATHRFASRMKMMLRK